VTETPFNDKPDSRRPGDEDSGPPPKPEQIWPPPASRDGGTPLEPEEKPVELDWADEVGKIDEAIDEIRRINGAPVIEEDLAMSPIEAEDVEDSPDATLGGFSGATVSAKCRVRPQSENELAQLWGSVFFSAEQPAPKAVLVTSARRGDGATQIASALALIGAGASDELQICLADFNLRKAGVADLLGVKNQPGLSEVINGKCRWEAAIQTISLRGGHRLFFLPSGAPAEQPLGMIKSRQTKALLAQLRDRFDHVILDSPCANNFPDAQIIGTQVDGVLLVVRAGDTPRESVAEAKKRFDLAGVRCIGLVMNQRHDPIPTALYRRT
jgi:capsular exopolysaccharide synthesis family protein